MAAIRELRDALQRMINGRWASIPVQPGDADILLSEAIDELARFREVARALLTRNDFWDHAGPLPGEYDDLMELVGEIEEGVAND